MATETWKLIDNVKGILMHSTYQVSDLGRVRRAALTGQPGSNGYSYVGRLRKLNKNNDGYLYVDLYPGDGIRVSALVHNLVAKAFLGDKPEGCQVDHKNHKLEDCRLTNLQYLPAEKNKAFGKYNKASKLSVNDVKEIRILRKQGHPYQNIANAYGVYKSTIINIIKERTWKEV